MGEMLQTRWSTTLGLQVPIVSAPMGGASGGELAAAVSRAGGLGMVAAGSSGSVAQLQRELAIVRDADVRFGIGLIAWAVEREPELLAVAIAAQPTLLSVSFGAVTGWPERACAAGIMTAAQVYDRASARRAREAGIDVIVARGREGGGHGADAVSTLPLLDAVLDACDGPVLAAGGIATGRGIVAAIAAGAAGVWLGTCFAACSESLLPDGARQRIVAAAETDTIYTRAFDLAAGDPWPEQYGERTLVNDFARRWTGREHDLVNDQEAIRRFHAACADGDYSVAPVNAGQGVGTIDRVRPAAEVIADLSSEATRLLAPSR